MPAKHVHWADEEEGPAFVPPPTPWTPPLMLTNTDDSITESPPPPTPQSACGNFYRQDLTSLYNDPSTSCAMISPPSAYAQPIPADEVPVTPTFYPETEHSQLHTSIDIRSLITQPSTNRHSPQRNTPTLNRYLEYNAQVPPLVWDVCEEPTVSNVRLTDNSPVPEAILESAASSPPSREMRIQCIWHAGWKPLTIHIATSPTGGPPPGSPQYISVLMVIKEMHKYLQRKVTAAEYARFAAIPREQDVVASAFYARCERHLRHGSPGSRAANRERADRATQSGLRRVDCLRGLTMFQGLTSSKDEEGLWHVHCAPAAWLPDPA